MIIASYVLTAVSVAVTALNFMLGRRLRRDRERYLAEIAAIHARRS